MMAMRGRVMIVRMFVLSMCSSMAPTSSMTMVCGKGRGTIIMQCIPCWFGTVVFLADMYVSVRVVMIGSRMMLVVSVVQV